MTVYLGWQRAVVLVGYDTVKEALVDQADDFSGRAPIPFLHKATKGYGNIWNFILSYWHGIDPVLSCISWLNTSHLLCSSGLGISNEERWRQLRRFTLTTLRDFGMGRKGMEDWIQEESKHMRARMETFNGVPLFVFGVIECSYANLSANPHTHAKQSPGQRLRVIALWNFLFNPPGKGWAK